MKGIPIFSCGSDFSKGREFETPRSTGKNEESIGKSSRFGAISLRLNRNSRNHQKGKLFYSLFLFQN
jgi:hypothetical protein